MTNLASDGVALAEHEPPHLRQRHVDVLLPGKEPGGAEEAVPLRQDVEETRRRRRRGQLLLAHLDLAMTTLLAGAPSLLAGRTSARSLSVAVRRTFAFTALEPLLARPLADVVVLPDAAVARRGRGVLGPNVRARLPGATFGSGRLRVCGRRRGLARGPGGGRHGRRRGSGP